LTRRLYTLQFAYCNKIRHDTIRWTYVRPKADE